MPKIITSADFAASFGSLSQLFASGELPAPEHPTQPLHVIYVVATPQDVSTAAAFFRSTLGRSVTFEGKVQTSTGITRAGVRLTVVSIDDAGPVSETAWAQVRDAGQSIADQFGVQS